MAKTKQEMTLDRVLSRFGIASRSDARRLIQAGRVKVNGRVSRDPEEWVRPVTDALHLDGRRLRPRKRIYLLLYKPKGVVTSHGDPDRRKTVYDHLPSDMSWVFPVGRLDKDTSGLLLLTNDTEFAQRMTNPASGLPKYYRVKAGALMSDSTIEQLRAGVALRRGERAQPLRVTRLQDKGKYTWLEIVLTEGKNREVRRMLEQVGHTVLKLVRTGIGSLTLQGLEVGGWRRLTDRELASLRGAVPSPGRSGAGRRGNRPAAAQGITLKVSPPKAR